ncbi:hypothetical protein P389DRAFT_16491 [Cystobasidium minutum MCA 4210]|uniref:uncharacterized protein n=1 Tax=Cystobasidium minutum MCA 4210 TaxID=1397322 RepID=UPI0034CD7FBD|eukprot:jgi/Rhomi1/16491/CE16490_321
MGTMTTASADSFAALNGSGGQMNTFEVAIATRGDEGMDWMELNKAADFRLLLFLAQDIGFEVDLE